MAELQIFSSDICVCKDIYHNSFFCEMYGKEDNTVICVLNWIIRSNKKCYCQ